MYTRDIANFEKGTLIDVRYREEYDLNHVPNSINIPWDMHLYYLDELMELPKPLMLFCEEGYRSGLVVLSLRTIGFTDVHNAGSWVDVMNEMEEPKLAA
jgi:phage shock protein E